MFKHCEFRFKWDLSQLTSICTLWPLIAVVAMLSGLRVSVAHGQQAGETAGRQSPNSRESEISTRTTDGDIKVQVNLVLVRAVVKDSAGKIIPDLKQQDFRIFDNGKLRNSPRLTWRRRKMVRPVCPRASSQRLRYQRP
jgi:hypothetical protein